MDAEAAKLKAEQDKMQKDMDKFFDASGAVVSTNICLIYFPSQDKIFEESIFCATYISFLNTIESTHCTNYCKQETRFGCIGRCKWGIWLNEGEINKHKYNDENE